jgi:hypothetical protein
VSWSYPQQIDDDKRNVGDEIERKHDDLEETKETVDRDIEGFSCHREALAVHSKNPISGPYQEQGRDNQQSSIHDGAPHEECSNDVDIHGYFPLCSARIISFASS